MSPEQHLECGRRVMAGLAKLAFPGDYLALVDGAVTAGYHFGNALLHRYGMLPEAEHANTPSKLPVAIADLPAAIQPAFKAFVELERLRSEYVRSPSVHNASLDAAVRGNLETLTRAAL